MNTRNTKRDNLHINSNINNKTKESNKKQVIHREKLDINDETNVTNNSNNDWSEEKDPKDGKSVFYCKWRLCSFRTVSECLIRKHTIKHQKPYMCSFVSCDQRFSQTKDLLNHFSSTHLDTNAFKCNFANCSLAFSDLKSLTDHRVSHVSKSLKFSKKCGHGTTTDDCETQTLTERQMKKKIIYEKKAMIEERLKNQNIVSLRLSDCVDYKNSFHNNREDLMKDSDSEKAVSSQRLVFTFLF